MIPKTLLTLVFAFGIFLFSNGVHAAPITNLSFRFDVIGGKWIGGQYIPLYTGQNYSPEQDGVFSGEIYGLQDNATSAAQGIKLISINNNSTDPAANARFTYNFLFSDADVNTATRNFKNSFTVTNGVVTAANLVVTGQKNYPSYPYEILSVQLNQPAADGVRVNLAEESRFEYSGATEVNKALNEGGLAGVTFTAIPEPSTYVLLGLGAVALLIAARCRRTA